MDEREEIARTCRRILADVAAGAHPHGDLRDVGRILTGRWDVDFTLALLELGAGCSIRQAMEDEEVFDQADLPSADDVRGILKPVGSDQIAAPSLWRPIETAPKGLWIGLWVVHQPDDYCEDYFARFSIGYWRPENITPGFEREAGWEATWIGEPTHWMPLPSPPYDEEGGSRG
jgi:hypothetical protein